MFAGFPCLFIYRDVVQLQYHPQYQLMENLHYTLPKWDVHHVTTLVMMFPTLRCVHIPVAILLVSGNFCHQRVVLVYCVLWAAMVLIAIALGVLRGATMYRIMNFRTAEETFMSLMLVLLGSFVPVVAMKRQGHV